MKVWRVAATVLMVFFVQVAVGFFSSTNTDDVASAVTFQLLLYVVELLILALIFARPSLARERWPYVHGFVSLVIVNSVGYAIMWAVNETPVEVGVFALVEWSIPIIAMVLGVTAGIFRARNEKKLGRSN